MILIDNNLGKILIIDAWKKASIPSPSILHRVYSPNRTLHLVTSKMLDMCLNYILDRTWTLTNFVYKAVIMQLPPQHKHPWSSHYTCSQWATLQVHETSDSWFPACGPDCGEYVYFFWGDYRPNTGSTGVSLTDEAFTRWTDTSMSSWSLSSTDPPQRAPSLQLPLAWAALPLVDAHSHTLSSVSNLTHARFRIHSPLLYIIVTSGITWVVWPSRGSKATVLGMWGSHGRFMALSYFNSGGVLLCYFCTWILHIPLGPIPSAFKKHYKIFTHWHSQLIGWETFMCVDMTCLTSRI